VITQVEFCVTSKYTTIKPGENRITVKYECANNAALTSYSSVTGVPSATTPAVASSSSVSAVSYSTQSKYQQRSERLARANDTNNHITTPAPLSSTR
jgi:hypothetical protein